MTIDILRELSLLIMSTVFETVEKKKWYKPAIVRSFELSRALNIYRCLVVYIKDQEPL